MPVKQVRLPGLSERDLSARWYQALIGPIQATGFAGGYDLIKLCGSNGRDCFMCQPVS